MIILATGRGAREEKAMRSRQIQPRLKKTGLLLGGIFAGIFISGATPHEFSVISKDDRIVHLASCETQAGTVDEASCGAGQPDVSVEAITVAPGLTVVSADPG